MAIKRNDDPYLIYSLGNLLIFLVIICVVISVCLFYWQYRGVAIGYLAICFVVPMFFNR